MSHVDYIYTTEDYIKSPKDQFKRVFQWLQRNINNNNSSTFELIDLGCARGELIYFLNQNIENVNFTGVDYSENLIKLANELNNELNVCFVVGDVEEYKTDKKFDFLTTVGVIEYLDFPEKIVKKIGSLLKKGGKAFILNIFNEYDIDVRIRYRNNQYFNEYKSGWSLHSLKTFREILNQNDLKICKQEKFFPDFVLEPKEDPARSWMVKMPNGEFKYTNGLSQLYDAYVLEVEKI